MLTKEIFEKNKENITRKVINMGFLNDTVPQTWEDQDQGTYLIDHGNYIEISIDNEEDADNPIVGYVDKE